MSTKSEELEKLGRIKVSLLAEEFDSFSRSDSSFIHAKDDFFVVIQLHMRHSLDSLQYRDTAW